MESESILDYNGGNEESENCSNESLEGYVRQLLLAIGEEPKREGLLKTPLRYRRSSNNEIDMQIRPRFPYS